MGGFRDTLRGLFAGRALSARFEAENQVRVLAELSRTLGSTLESPQATNALITEAVTTLLHVERSILFVPAEDGASLEVAAASGIVDPADLGRFRIPLNDGAVGHAFTTGKTVIVSDTANPPFPLTNLVRELGSRSLVAVPLRMKAEVLGVISADTRRDGTPLGREDVRLLEVFAGFAALIRAELQLIDELRTRSEKLNSLLTIARRINSEDGPASVLQQLLHHAIEHTAAQSGSIAFVDPDQHALIVRASEGLPDMGPHLRLGLDQGITGWVAREGQSARIADVTRDARYVQARGDVRSELAVPVRVGGEVIGIINLDADQPDAFSAGHQAYLETLAELAAARIRLAFASQKGETP